MRHSALTNLSLLFLLLLPLLSPLPSLSLLAAADGGPTAYDALQDFNFPEGLLPKGATGYDLDEGTGRFRAYLNGSCSFSLEGSYQLKYESTVSGYISQNKLTQLTGVSVKILFLWLNIVEVVRRGDDIELSVGIVSASFPIDNFYECPQCGCGLDCLNGPTSKLRTKLFASSRESELGERMWQSK